MNKLARKLKRRQKKVSRRYQPSKLTYAISKTFKRVGNPERRVIADAVPWYVLRTKVKQERIAALRLRELGHDVFLPEYTEEVVRTHGLTKEKRRVDVTRPLLPRYCFVAPSCDPRQIVRDVDEVEAVLGFDDRPIAVPARALQRISDVLTGHDEEAKPIEIAPFLPGEKVRVVDGPFASFEAEIEDIAASGRITALLDLFGRATPVELDLAQIVRLD